jgi:hypothetical protein
MMAKKRVHPTFVSSYSPPNHKPRKISRPKQEDLLPKRKIVYQVDNQALYAFKKGTFWRQKYGNAIVLIIEKRSENDYFIHVNECYEIVPAQCLHPVSFDDDENVEE